jgi:hypothetical protein
MHISLTQLLIWVLIAAFVGIIGELIAHRRAPDGIMALSFSAFSPFSFFSSLVYLRKEAQNIQSRYYQYFIYLHLYIPLCDRRCGLIESLAYIGQMTLHLFVHPPVHSSVADKPPYFYT